MDPNQLDQYGNPIVQQKPVITPGSSGNPNAPDPYAPGTPTPPKPSLPMPGGIPSVPGGVGGLPGGSIIPPVPPPTMPSTPLSTFGPGNDLQSTQINPNASPDTAAARGLISSNLSQVAGAAPDRLALAKQAMQTLDENQANTEKLGVQNIGREGAAAGRLGSGMVSTSLGDLQSQLNQERLQAERGLSGDVASQTLADRTAALNASEGATGQLAGLDTASQNALRGERGYEAGQAQTAVQNQVQQKALEDSLLNSQFGRNLDTANFENSVAGGYGGDAQAAAAGAGGLMSQLSLQQYLAAHPELNPTVKAA